MTSTTQLPEHPSTARIPADKAHILVVDDEPEIAESLIDFLQRKTNYTVSHAEDGREAVDYLQAIVEKGQEIDLVLLDMRMPKMSGRDVLSWIRQHPDLQYTRVVLLTAAAASHEKVEALSAGADDYITKPYYPQELLARVQTILRTQQLEKQLQRQSQQLAALNRISQRIAAKLETQEVLATAVAKVRKVIDLEYTLTALLEKGQLRIKSARRDRVPVEDHAPRPVGPGITGFVFNEKTAVFLNHPQDDPRYEADIDAPLNLTVRSLIMVPIIVRGRAVGLFCGYNKQDGDFTEFDLELFSSLASSISEALANAWLFQKIRQRQQELLENRNTLQALIDGIPHPIYTINDDWQLVSINKSKLDELGDMPETANLLDSDACYKAFYDRDTPCDHCLVHHTLTKRAGQHWSVKWIGPDHLPREWDVDAYPIPSTLTASARAVILWQDRTEERRLESSLLQAGKLAAIGQLAAGVAHEINNPLTAVNANAQLLKMVIPEEDDNYESVDLIARAGERATKVVRGLLDFARQEQYAFTSASANKSVQQTLELVRYQLGNANIEIITNLDPELPAVAASWEHLKSVWLNLIVNARDAVREQPEPRQIEITTRIAPDDDQSIQILFRDNGKGMSTAELAHIFEPFYTTKDPGKGTGLGLATSHSIVEQHGGEIQVASVPNEGTTFIIRLPIR